jgi:hypothetical protein
MLAILFQVLTVTHPHALVMLPWHHVMILCQLTVSHGQAYANGCIR